MPNWWDLQQQRLSKPATVAAPNERPSQNFGQQNQFGQQRGNRQANQQNDFMSQMRSYMQQQQQQQAQFRQNPAQTGPQMSQMFGNQRGAGGVAAGDYLSEAFARDYANQAGARQQTAQNMRGFMEGMRGVPAMGMAGIDMAQQSGREGADIARQGMEEMMRQAKGAQGVATQTRGDVARSMGLAKGEMQKGINTMQKAIADQDFFRKDTVASGLQGVQGQFQSAKEGIMSNPNLSDEDKQVQIDNLNNTMRQQAASYASQADSQAADSLLQAKNALSSMQLSMGSTLGGLGMQGAGLSSSAGMQASGMGLQAAQAGYQLMNAQSQFAGNLANSAIAQAMKANLDGNALGAQLAMQIPMGAPNLADTILAMMNAQGMRPGTETTGPFAGRLGGLLGNQNFTGYGERQQQAFGNNQPFGRISGSLGNPNVASTFRGPV
jgi:hypothetical protein